MDALLDALKELPGWVQTLVLVAFVVTAGKGLLDYVLAAARFVARSLRHVALVDDRIDGDGRARDRRSIASMQVGQLQWIDVTAGWLDARFAELEAEVETEMPRQTRFALTRLFRFRSETRREPSLTSALTKLGLDKAGHRFRWRRRPRERSCSFTVLPAQARASHSAA